MDYFDREVDLILMLKYLLKKWMYILLAMALCAVAGVGFGYYKYQSALNAQTNPYGSDEEMKELYNSLSKDDQERVDYIVKLNEKMTEMENYIHNGILMKVDPYHIPTVYSYYDLAVDPGTYNSDLERISLVNQLRDAYENYIKNGGIVTELAKYYPEDTIEAEHFNEMVDLTFNPEPLGNSSFAISVKQMEDLPDFDENVNRLLQEYSEELNQKVAKHQLTPVSKSNKILRSEPIMDFQERIRSRYDNTRNTIRLMNVNGELSDDVIKCYEFKIGETGYHLKTEEELADTSSKIKFILKYALVVIFGGIVLVIALLCLYYLVFIFGKYIISTDDYAFLNLNYLGDMADEVQFAGVVSKIKKYCQNKGISSITLLSTDLPSVSNDMLAKLRNELKKRDINGELFNEKSLKGANGSYIDQLLSMKHCLFIEKVNSTKIDKLYEIVKLCNENEIGIVGVVNR